MTNTNTKLDDNLLKKCAKGFFNDVKPFLDTKKYQPICLTEDEAINGIDGVAYIDPMNKRTSAGAPFYKNKKEFLIQRPDGKYDLKPEMKKICAEYRERYARGEKCTPIYASAQKDEPKKRAKCKDGARIFICSSLPWIIVVRQITMWFVRLVQNNRLPFECGVGVSAQSIEWQHFFDFLTKWNPNLMVAGDYKDYDKSMGANVILCAFDFMVMVAAELGAPMWMLISIQAIGEDVAFAFVDFDGDIIMFLGGNPSGHPLTVIINCIVGCLYVRYAFVKITGKLVSEFKSHVRLLTYGDDNVFGVHPSIPEFNHTSIQKCFRENGITYTMADKTAESIPYLPISKVSFLKRTWEMRDGRMMAPLERESIVKMLTIHTVSGSLCEEAQTVAAMGSAVREAAMHGEPYFDEITNLCKAAVCECKLDLWVDKSTFPSYADIMCRWDENSAAITAVYESRGGVPGL
jgi:hypothetical protein